MRLRQLRHDIPTWWFMKVLTLNADDVRSLLHMNECRELMHDTLSALARENAINPLRQGMWLPERVGVLGMMPGAILEDPSILGIKVISVFPGNHGSDLDCHQGAVMLFNSQNGCPLAFVDASALTEIRTACVTAVATRALARPDSDSLGILGSGVQARSHLFALLQTVEIGHVNLWSRNIENARKLAQHVQEKLRQRLSIKVCETAEEAVRESTIVCTTTASNDPVVSGEWLQPGQHINAIGASVRFARELDTEAVVRSKMFVDRRESAENEAGEFIFAQEEGAIDGGHIRGELGDVLIGKVPGRESDEEITLFKSLGLAVEDLASANHVFKKAKDEGVGTWIEW